jgi:small subunit ribosomal protein S6
MALEISTSLANIKVMYETTFLVTPEIPESGYKEVAKKFEELIKKNGGEVTNLEHWGLKQLAYNMGKHGSAFYCYMEFTAPPRMIAKLEQEYLYDERVIRFLTIKVEKHHAAFNKKRREQGFGKKKEEN